MLCSYLCRKGLNISNIRNNIFKDALLYFEKCLLHCFILKFF